jgi:hypothetical protein
MNDILYKAVSQLAAATHLFTDADLGQPYAWRKHEEGVRFALLGTTQELRDLAVQLMQERAQKGLPVTAVQRVLAQNHAGFRDLQAVLFGISDENYSQEPAPGEWPLRYVLGHIVGAERRFFSLALSGLAYKRVGQTPPPLPDDAPETLVGPYAEFRELMEQGTLAGMMAHFQGMHFRSWEEFGGLSDEELAAPSPLWWEEETYSIQYRLHRFEAHLRQHLIQAEKTLDQLGKPQTEAKRLLRLVNNALAEVEALTIGAADVGISKQQALAQTIQQRADEVTAVTQQARALETAVKAGDRATVQTILQADPKFANALDQNEPPPTKPKHFTNPKIANALDQNRLSLVLTAVYHHEPEIAQLLVEAGAELSIFSAAALGNLAKVQAFVQEWDGFVNEYNTDGFTALQLACFFGQPEIALWLIEQGADVNAIARNPMKISPVHATAANGNLSLLRTLLEKGANVNAQQQGGFTPLHEATHANNPAMVQLLLEFGADKTLVNEDGRTPLEQAIADGSQEVIQLL